MQCNHHSWWNLLSLPLVSDLQQRGSTHLWHRCLEHLLSDASNVKFRSKRVKSRTRIMLCLLQQPGQIFQTITTDFQTFLNMETTVCNFNFKLPRDKDSYFRLDSVWVNYLLKLFLSLLFHPPDVLHGQTHPFVNPTEQLAVEVGENTLFLLWKTDRHLNGKKKEKKKEYHKGLYSSWNKDRFSKIQKCFSDQQQERFVSFMSLCHIHHTCVKHKPHSTVACKDRT